MHARSRPSAVERRWSWISSANCIAATRGSLPHPACNQLGTTRYRPGVPTFSVPIANYLAARLFGNWVAYQGHGLRSVVAWVRACYDVLRVIAMADRPASAAPLSTVESAEGDSTDGPGHAPHHRFARLRTRRRRVRESACGVMSSALERFLRYVTIDTRSNDSSTTCPSTPGQLELARLLKTELTGLGALDVVSRRVRLRDGHHRRHARP